MTEPRGQVRLTTAHKYLLVPSDILGYMPGLSKKSNIYYCKNN